MVAKKQVKHLEKVLHHLACSGLVPVEVKLPKESCPYRGKLCTPILNEEE